ncbi:hypothetical protein DFH09DRAFT_1154058, partial [Mycena vulgaris]
MSAQPSSARGPPSSATASVPSVSTASASNFVPLPSSKGVVSSASATLSGFSSAIIAPSPSVSQSAIGSTMTSGRASSPSSQVPPIPPKRVPVVRRPSQVHLLASQYRRLAPARRTPRPHQDRHPLNSKFRAEDLFQALRSKDLLTWLLQVEPPPPAQL